MNLDSVFVLKNGKGYVSDITKNADGSEKLTYSDFWMDAKPFMGFDSDKDNNWYPLKLAKKYNLKIVQITATEDDFE